jgi:hypothetical protein
LQRQAHGLSWNGRLELMLIGTNSPVSSEAGKSPLKNPLFYSSVVLGIAALVVAWVLGSRWIENREIERRSAEERAQKQKEQDRAALEQFGGKDLDIQSFYAIPAAVRRGETVQLCYGVANAKTVTLEPQPNPVWPSYSRCVDVKPTKTTTYTLTIADAGSHTKSQTLEVKVH